MDLDVSFLAVLEHDSRRVFTFQCPLTLIPSLKLEAQRAQAVKRRRGFPHLRGLAGDLEF